MFRENNGKLSMARIMAFTAFIVAVVLSILIIVLAMDAKNMNFGPAALPLVYAFLTFAAGAKIGSKFGEKTPEEKGVEMGDAQ